MSSQSNAKGHLSWWKLALLGMGFTTGTGFFLGSSMAIEKSGFSVLILFLLAAVGTYFVFDALANMIAQHAEQGSFRTYSKKAFGHWAGFSHGWMYWLSEMLILGSQLTAIGLFTRYWFPQIPLWILTSVYAILGIIVVLLGTKGFEKVENAFAVIKVSAILLFIVLACLVFSGVLGKQHAHMHTPDGRIFLDGALGLWTSLIYVFFAFAGIEVMGLMASQLKHPQDAPKSGKVMLSIVTVLYIVSIGLALFLAPMENFNSKQSPFVTALKDLKFELIVHIFNGVLIVAGFSSLVASLFSVTQMMYTIAKAGDAPHILTKMSRRKIPYTSLILTVCGMIVSIVIALVLPEKVYEYITTAGGLMLLYSWLFMVFSARKLLKLSVWGHIKTIAAAILIVIAAIGTLFDKTSRPGFFTSFAFLAIIAIALLFLRKRWKRAA
ncbi:amino acid permease [Brevibacillus fulvus]|uniref:L-asparagine transporter-like permease n=1 Tax=Brevibacillus fulvus TaxID=1125967 RepID=A0A939BRC5_9BACL|nr:amino acid permease [Brevibacillus fulvus]MBM7589457.1 L-asparagine transporter-like permease [Brevibacillus fulvus]